ncbi:MAG: hypothetical protein NVS2B12_01600 [Ktedonobacteraceae bacterium]
MLELPLTNEIDCKKDELLPGLVLLFSLFSHHPRVVAVKRIIRKTGEGSDATPDLKV